jgi:peptide/nickel transport system substrate-binding protein
LVKGNIDFISGLDNSYKDNILNNNGGLNKSYTDRINMLRGPFLNTEYLAFFSGSNQKEIKSPLIRKAINIGFDKEKMVKFLRNGIGKAGNGGFIPKGMIGHNSKSINVYNPENARKLVDIYKRTNGTPKIELTTSSNYLILCEFIQKELENIGIQISINVIPGSSLKQAKANGKLDFFRASWIADYPDAENYMALFYSKNFSPNGPNYTHFKNENFDKLYEKMIKETDQSERVKMYKKMDSIVISKSIIVPLYYDEVTRFLSKNVKGMEITATNLLDLRRVYKED